ncbi:MAG: hypothetical protein Q9M30_09155, partial [Mariprofundaceae bacterium]|nr:hypothetical protein [Mariprofundaceae bacterium]
IWPHMLGRKAVSGRMTGDVHLLRDWMQEGWQITMDGDFSHVRLAADHLPAWNIALLHLKGASFDANKGLRIGEMRIEDADMVFKADLSAAHAVLFMPVIDLLQVQSVRPSLLYADGSSLTLPALSGQGHLGKNNQLSLQGAVTATAAGSEPLSRAETWKIEAEGDFTSTWQADIHAHRVPLVRLRSLLPDVSLSRESGAPEYEGDAGLKVHIRGQDDALHIAGKLILDDAQMRQGGDSLRVPHLEAVIADAGWGGVRKISSIKLDDWQYQLALRPLTARQKLASPSQSVAGADSEKVDAVRLPDSTPVTDKKAGSGVSLAARMVSEVSVDVPEVNWMLDELLASNGRISLGQSDALMAEGVSLRVLHLGSKRMSPFTLNGSLSGGSVYAQGKIRLQSGFRLQTRAKIRAALPFAFNDWMRLSGMSRFVRGRLNADLRLQADQTESSADAAYAGELKLSLNQGRFEVGISPDDPLPQLTGYTTHGLFERLNQADGFALRVPVRGLWEGASLTTVFGDASLKALKEAAAISSTAHLPVEPKPTQITRLRLLGKRGFSYNERVRMRHMIRILQKNKKLILELIPKLAPDALDDAMIARVRRTQEMVARFMQHRGIARMRLYPVWPQAMHQHGDVSALLLQARMP